MSTAELLQRAGLPALLGTLLLTLTVVVLRLVALPLALTVLALDRAAVLVAGTLPHTGTPPPGGV